MISIEDVETMLDELAEELPSEFYEKLNGGILLVPEEELHPKNVDGNLYVLGRYNYNHTMGRFITIYYGSFIKLFGHLTKENFKKELKNTLVHEFTHHLESLAGERALEIKDAQKMKEYRERFKK